MSFTIDVKNELCECVLPQSLTDVLKYGLLYPLDFEKKSFVTDSRCVENTFKELFGGYIATEQVSRRNGLYHKIKIRGKKLAYLWHMTRVACHMPELIIMQLPDFVKSFFHFFIFFTIYYYHSKQFELN